MSSLACVHSSTPLVSQSRITLCKLCLPWCLQNIEPVWQPLMALRDSQQSLHPCRAPPPLPAPALNCRISHPRTSLLSASLQAQTLGYSQVTSLMSQPSSPRLAATSSLFSTHQAVRPLLLAPIPLPRVQHLNSSSLPVTVWPSLRSQVRPQSCPKFQWGVGQLLFYRMKEHLLRCPSASNRSHKNWIKCI